MNRFASAFGLFFGALVAACSGGAGDDPAPEIVVEKPEQVEHAPRPAAPIVKTSDAPINVVSDYNADTGGIVPPPPPR